METSRLFYMVETVLKILEAGFSIWASKERNKYRDELISLKQEYYDEYNKPFEERDDGKLDRILFRLRCLGDSFATSVGNENNAAKS
ncbi:hypothetical protein E6Q11_02505 [Candidatus Dojkabacteria bacterium]|uniref:Uncharacterized protein n=1 Tax=Candidatus Dojkabacteria bacterium TaxID=2099670 RepID=A0A5C7J7U7_9BACT|nr:MAG: hypothetical protein E6Q11_02505 [Candidatus Dojkabacteria bacterium]